jgi:hypothetical protein
MAFDKNQFEALIKKILAFMERYIPKVNSPAAVNLLLGTAAVESELGTYLRQLGDGPALGPFQMEPNTESDIWMNYIRHRQALKDCLFALCGATGPQPEKLETDLAYAIVMARIHYLRKPERLPAADNIPALGGYWKCHYNTLKRKGTIEGFIKNYNVFVRGLNGEQRPKVS